MTPVFTTRKSSGSRSSERSTSSGRTVPLSVHAIESISRPSVSRCGEENGLGPLCGQLSLLGIKPFPLLAQLIVGDQVLFGLGEESSQFISISGLLWFERGGPRRADWIGLGFGCGHWSGIRLSRRGHGFGYSSFLGFSNDFLYLSKGLL